MKPEYSHSPIDFRYMSPAIKALILINVGAFALVQLAGSQIYEMFGLVPVAVWQKRWVWQVVTYLFIHGSFFQLLLNLLTLWMFAIPIESQWGSKEFIKYYLLCGVGAGIVSVVSQPNSPAYIIGASGAIYGLLVAYAMLYPDAILYLYFFFPIRARYVAVLAGLMIFFTGPTILSSAVARLTQLSGMIIGYLYLRWWWELEIQLKDFWRRRLGQAPGRSSRKSSRIEPVKRKLAAADQEDDLEEEVNRILDKISAQGRQSLSSEELEILRRQSERKKWGHA